MPSFPWRPRMRGVTPAGDWFTVETVILTDATPNRLFVIFGNPKTAPSSYPVVPLSLDAAAPDLNDEATVGAYIGAIKDRLNRDAGGWVVFPYYSSTRGRWRIEARKEGKEHRGEAKCLGEGFTRASALKAAWHSVNA